MSKLHKLPRKGSKRAAVYEALSSTSFMTIRQLVRATGRTIDSVHADIRELRSRGLVESRVVPHAHGIGEHRRAQLSNPSPGLWKKGRKRRPIRRPAKKPARQSTKSPAPQALNVEAVRTLEQMTAYVRGLEARNAELEKAISTIAEKALELL